ncbi:uncharacterized protein GGS22DRAFT_183497 [Annulohypoxylon maeteangense]|uniref:uncharacterized protein n=1 Tax=Annulohypoxylon maeteangense TaxID=1927788 RepID=UPI0020080CFB|nr:uncharacterized protein GGS22DRAFT_183497 [Annulohypoxylon maeteangense]KAI0890150.1 hypothetical protein GGS22DRAFT_183497 [Annulohypoxylon maeteangense]
MAPLRHRAESVSKQNKTKKFRKHHTNDEFNRSRKPYQHVMAFRQLKTTSTYRHVTARLLAYTAGLLLILIWTCRLMPSHPPHSPATLLHHQQTRPNRDRNEDTAADLSSARAPFIAWPLRRVCAETTYVPGLTFVCDNNSGGPGNIRNYILTCIRYAVDAGATGLVLPRIRARSVSNLDNLFRESQPFGYMFDELHFRRAMADACPRIAVYAEVEDVPGAREKARREGRSVERIVEKVTPKRFGGSRAGCDQRDPNRYTDLFGSAFRDWLRDSAAERGWAPVDDVDNPRLIRLSWGVLWDWPVFRDGQEFAATFGGLLRVREDILDLADTIVTMMRIIATSTKGTETVAGDSFFGVHLRSEADALSQWPSYENQTKSYLREAASQGYQGRVAYLASGNKTEAEKFGKEALATLQLDVRSKYDLFDKGDEELEKLEELSWDQQALVDFVVLLNCDYFTGVSPSSFSINVALKRHLKEEGLYTRPWKVGGQGDGRSWLVGRFDRYWEDWLFMFDGMWP